MKTRLLTLLLALAMTLSLAACGGKDAAVSGSASADTSQTEESSSASSSAPDTSIEESEAEDTGSGEDAGLPEEEKEPEAEQPAEQKPVAQKPAKQPTQSGSASGSAGSSGSSSAQPESSSVDLTAFYESQAAAFGENFPAMMAMDGEALAAFYPGLADLSPRQCLVTMPMISAVAAEFALVEVSSADQVESVKAIFQARVDYQVEQGAFYPATAEAWENNVRIVSSGNYVMMVCFDQCDAVVSGFNALF